MGFLLHFTPDTYTNLKADLISRNKIDGVVFELNEISQTYGEQYSGDINVFKVKDNTLELDESIKPISSTEEVKELFKNEKNLKLLLQEGERQTLFIAMEIKPKDRLHIEPRFKVSIKMLDSKDEIQLDCNNLEIVNDITFIEENKMYIQIINDSKIFIYTKVAVIRQDILKYTQKLTIKIEAQGWTKTKRNVSYVLDGEGNLVEVTEDAESGELSHKMEFPFKYPSNDFLQYDTTYELAEDPYRDKTGGLWHKYIALDILHSYRYGRRTVSFEVPEVQIPYCDEKGRDQSERADITALRLGTKFLISEREWTDDKKPRFAGGSYRESLIYAAEAPPPIVDRPRQYKITNIEYKYDGSFRVSVKALEVPYAATLKEAATA